MPTYTQYMFIVVLWSEPVMAANCRFTPTVGSMYIDNVQFGVQIRTTVRVVLLYLESGKGHLKPI